MIPMAPLQSWAFLGCLVLAGYLVWQGLRICGLRAEAVDDLEVDPYDRDQDPFGYIDEETDRWRDQQLLDDDLEDRHG